MIAVVSANFGGIDGSFENERQLLAHDFFLYTDQNFPQRMSLTPRLQAKIPKCFAWQLAPDYEYYLWLDGNIRLAHGDALEYLYDEIQGFDILVLRHPRRPNIRQEVRYTRKGLREQSIYMVSRYTNELLKEQYDVIQQDKEYVDDLLVNGGMFMYRNTPKVQAMLKEWWYHISRYIIQDQISFPYVLKKSGIRINVLEEIYNDCWFLKYYAHQQRNK